MQVRSKDVYWGYLGTFSNLGINILLLPIVLNYLSGDELGLWYVFSSIGSIVVLLDFGFAPTLARNIAYSWTGAKELKKEDVVETVESGPNLALLKKVLSTCKYIYLLMSIIALVLLAIIGTVYILNVGKDIETSYLLLCWGIYGFAVFFNMYIGYFSSFLKGVGAISEYNKAMVVSKMVQIVISLILLMNGLGLLAVTFAYLLCGMINRILCKRYFYTFENIGERLNEVNVNLKKEDIISSFKVIWHNAWKDGLVTVSNFLATQASTILCSLFLTLSETATYSLTLQVITIISNVASALYSTLQPTLQAESLKKNRKQSIRLMSMAMTTYTLIFVIGSILLCTIGIPIIKFLKPTIDLNIVYTITMCIYMYLFQHHSLYASYISNTNRIPYMNAYIVTSVITVIVEFAVLSSSNLGMWVLVIVPTLCQLVYNNWRWPYQVLKELKTNVFTIYRYGLHEIISIIKMQIKNIITHE